MTLYLNKQILFTDAVLSVWRANRVHHCSERIYTSYVKLISTYLKAIDIKNIDDRINFIFCWAVV